MKKVLLLAGLMLVLGCTRAGIVTDLSDLRVGDRTQVEGTLVALTQRGFILADKAGNNAYVYVGPDFDSEYYTIGDHVDVKADVTSYRGLVELQNAVVNRRGAANHYYPSPYEITESDFQTYISSPQRRVEYISSTGAIVSNMIDKFYLFLSGDSSGDLEFEFPVVDMNQYLYSNTGKEARIEGYSLWSKDYDSNTSVLCVVLTSIEFI